ncbi:MAG: tRNA (adenosine(37)-N6)-threonylcarbamoyltransferase complex dimerization subunit type 1 TsaB [Candidatus Pelagibacter sp.]|nr:tRNA (adenosine(37)-N6)-threonylcarbamoyltransferase complex dimerization subunit type 1 TsaB [Candidatus Pelagibacter sp.]OUT95760.1 MAG: tRNA (adenosine(37)-N6)-threonylcarbamoyltransferase complex dimerization subunit type 1 TsaB [Gammaproteobacteria bacterium TMED36]
MNFLSISFGTASQSIFIKLENKIFYKNLQNIKFGSDVLMDQILKLTLKKKIKFSKLSEVYINQGPGSFSGLRSSLAIAKGISLSQGTKLYGYNTFSWCVSHFLKISKPIYCILKIRKNYFIQKFNKLKKPILNPKIISKKDIITKYKDSFLVTTSDSLKTFDKEILNLKNLNITNLNHKMLEIMKRNNLLQGNLVKPLYFR